jgi:hypothetical protein
MKTFIVLIACTSFVLIVKAQTQPSKAPASKTIKASTVQNTAHIILPSPDKAILSDSENNSNQDISASKEKMKLAPAAPKNGNKPIEEDRPKPPPLAIIPVSKPATEKPEDKPNP